MKYGASVIEHSEQNTTKTRNYTLQKHQLHYFTVLATRLQNTSLAVWRYALQKLVGLLGASMKGK